jgi:NADPH:quinone reductase-like Zn-dependent oxidoreductase
MRQIWISKAGPPETLVLKEAPDPNPRAGEARIRVEASGVNFADVMGRMASIGICLEFQSFQDTKSPGASTQWAKASIRPG